MLKPPAEQAGVKLSVPGMCSRSPRYLKSGCRFCALSRRSEARSFVLRARSHHWRTSICNTLVDREQVMGIKGNGGLVNAEALKKPLTSEKVKKRSPHTRLLQALYFLLLTGCGNVELRPVELLPEDACTFCRMAISEKRFACELITKDGDAIQFDDIGCLLNYPKERSNVESAAFVVDFDTREWLKSEEAYFVKSKVFKTPMDGNVVAFKTGTDAAAAADRTQGVPLRYAALLEH